MTSRSTSSIRKKEIQRDIQRKGYIFSGNVKHRHKIIHLRQNNYRNDLIGIHCYFSFLLQL